MKSLLLLATLLVFPLSTIAATYSWTDPSGNMHFTDDIGSVPAKYRAKATKKAAMEERESSSPAPDKTVTNQDTTESLKTTPATTKEAAPVPQSDIGETRFGDRTANEWQQLLRSKRAELTLLEQKFEELKQETGNGKKMLTTQQINDINLRSKSLNIEYEAARLAYNELVDQASKAGLPSRFAP
jgi:hypothetical protein